MTSNFSEPTSHMRFIERPIAVDAMYSKSVRILQQLWRVIEDGSYRHYHEWRDVELTQETKWTTDE